MLTRTGPAVYEPPSSFKAPPFRTVNEREMSKWIATPPRVRAFVLPVDATLALMAPRGFSTGLLVKLTAPDGTVREIQSPGLNEDARTCVSGVVIRGTLVEPNYGLHVQVPVASQDAPLGYYWATIAEG